MKRKLRMIFFVLFVAATWSYSNGQSVDSTTKKLLLDNNAINTFLYGSKGAAAYFHQVMIMELTDSSDIATRIQPVAILPFAKWKLIVYEDPQSERLFDAYFNCVSVNRATLKNWNALSWKLRGGESKDYSVELFNRGCRNELVHLLLPRLPKETGETLSDLASCYIAKDSMSNDAFINFLCTRFGLALTERYEYAQEGYAEIMKIYHDEVFSQIGKQGPQLTQWIKGVVNETGTQLKLMGDTLTAERFKEIATQRDSLLINKLWSYLTVTDMLIIQKSLEKRYITMVKNL